MQKIMNEREKGGEKYPLEFERPQFDSFVQIFICIKIRLNNRRHIFE